ncbi:LURP-one-related/scramblase family protein [Serpentinicella alkaliphila]|uniref:Uncharacterized protein YxjI n=1 Tax=Serpentinicella alkaliphila TaxID=1734049 RepID=A0A4R2TRF1_9FIRM|nr:LURP-one-related family protein [Serpentinicella alkaliphila]QUH26365.1 LURP-one-related family protein [Serpentinicella alkaliphila]TCP97612.1 uncharacterized protein YxjI [Serpentinicella alkaliphila]
MKYKIRQRILSFGDNFTIKNEFEEDKYIVRGKVFAIGDKLRIYDLVGNELVYIEQKVLRFIPEYNLYSGGRHLATVKKEFTLLKPRFNITSSIGNYTINGGFFGYDFEIIKDGRAVASVNKKWISFADTYIAEIMEGEDQPFMLALVIVIDQVLHDRNHNKK